MTARMRLLRLLNDEIRLPNDERMPNDEIRDGRSILVRVFVIRAPSLIRHSAFELCHLLGWWETVSSSRGTLRGRKLLQKPRRFRLNSLQVVAVVNANDVPEIFALSDVRGTF